MKNLKDRRTINISKVDYDLLKSYCDDNTLDMPKWMVKNSKEKIEPTQDLFNGLNSIVLELENASLLHSKKTYENLKPSFRFTIDFLKKILFNSDPITKTMKLVFIKKYNTFYIKYELHDDNLNENKNFSYSPFCLFYFECIKNAYKDLCDDIHLGIQDNIEDGKLWWVCALKIKNDIEI